MRTEHSGVSIASAVLLVALSAPISALNNITITVHAGQQQVFKGFGTSIDNWGGFNNLPDASKDEISRLMWGPAGLNFQVLRLWSYMNRDAASMAATYGQVISYARKYNPDIRLLLAPTADNPGDLQSYARHYVDMIAGMRDDHGIVMNATGMCNEPNIGDYFTPEGMRDLVKQFREELDSRGLQDVAIVAPEVSSIDPRGYEYFDAIRNDPDAMDALTAISGHSYNMSMTREMADYVAETGKEYWMTEGSSNGYEAEKDDYQATKAAARILSEINLRTNYWVWFFGYGTYRDNDNATQIIAYWRDSGDYVQFLKYYYIQQISMVMEPGALVRTAETDREQSQDKYMEWTYGQKPYVTAAAALNPDSTWGIGVINCTDIGTTDWSDGHCCGDSWYAGDPIGWGYDAETFDITVHVEELAKAGDVEFRMYRSNKGSFSVTINPKEILCFRSVEPVGVFPVSVRRIAGRGRREENVLTFTRAGRQVARLHAVADGRAAIIDATGRTVREFLVSGRHATTFEIAGLPSGTYVVRVEGGGLGSYARRLLVGPERF